LLIWLSRKGVSSSVSFAFAELKEKEHVGWVSDYFFGPLKEFFFGALTEICRE